jgi:hypothetical protein
MSSSDRGKVDELSAKLARIKQQFDRGLAVQAGAIAVESDEKLKQILSEIRELTCFLLITDLITFSPGSTQDDYLNPDFSGGCDSDASHSFLSANGHPTRLNTVSPTCI